MQHHNTSNAAESKTCTKCGEAKPLTEFYQYKTGGRAGAFHAECKACKNAKNRAWDAEHRDERQAYFAEYRRNMSPEKRREYHAAYRTSHRYEYVQYDRAWKKRNGDRAAMLRREYVAANWEKIRAHGTVAHAVRQGNLPPARTMVCEDCQEAQAAHWHHHNGYGRSHRLDVIALCTECHGKAHAVQR